MRRRTKKTAVAVLTAGGVLALAGFLAGPQEAGAATSDKVEYTVGDVLVVSDRHRNTSCSMNRSVFNRGETAVRVIGTVSWPGHPEPLWPNSGAGANTDGLVLEPGDDFAEDNVLMRWTNHGYLPDDAEGMILTWYVLPADDPVAQTGATYLEPIEPCHAQSVPTTDPTVPPVDTTPGTVPPSTVDTVPGSSTTSPPPVGDPAPPTTVVDTQVLTSSVGPTELPRTGVATWKLTALGFALVVTGWSMVARSKVPAGGGEVRFPKGGRS